MFDFNLIVQEAEKITGFWSFSQNWFDILALVLTILSLWLAFWLGERGYRRDKKDKAKEHKNIVQSEINLFQNNLKQLLKAVNEQLKDFEEYKLSNKFSLMVHPDVQVDFLKFVDVKHVYENFGFENKDNLETVNRLFASLYSLNDFRTSLRDSFRTFISRHQDFEKGFYLYKKLMYKMLHEVCNRKAIDLQPEEGGVLINFGDNLFAENFHRLNNEVLSNPDLLNENNNVIRPKLIELFILPLIEICRPFIPADKDAIEVSDIANEVNSNWINMEVVTSAHSNEVAGHIAVLEKVKVEINKFLEL